jgi:hypothetical protein
MKNRIIGTTKESANYGRGSLYGFSRGRFKVQPISAGPCKPLLANSVQEAGDLPDACVADFVIHPVAAEAIRQTDMNKAIWDFIAAFDENVGRGWKAARRFFTDATLRFSRPSKSTCAGLGRVFQNCTGAINQTRRVTNFTNR